jgi:anaerobic selenocysteine-containing dehydrogenase
MGMQHCDGNTRLCMATAVVAHKQAFGFDAPPFTYADLEESDLLVFVGWNPAIAHPVLWQRIRKSERHPGIVVLDPRRTDTAALTGAEHLAVRPKSDLVLLYAVARLLIERGWIDDDFIRSHTAGFEDFQAFTEAYPLERAAAATGLQAEQIERLAEAIHSHERVSFWWMVGVNQGYEAVRTAQAIIDLALLTGNIGRPGTGANSITGQCNAMGSRLFSHTTGLPCGRDFGNAEHRAEVAAIMGLDENLIPTAPGLAYDQILDAVDRGEVKGLWIVCTNPAHSFVELDRLRKVLRKAEFVVVQDMFRDTETSKYAHLLLPAAGVGEKDGTLINSERRLGVVRRVLSPPGEALADFAIFQRIAERWGCAGLFQEWTSPAATFQVLKRLSAGRPCDFSGIGDYEAIEAAGGIQWPYPAGSDEVDRPGADPTAAVPAAVARERRLFEDGVFHHPDGRARFIFETPAAPPEAPDDEYPFVLLTGRGSATQWHTLTRTDRAPLLKRVSPDPGYVEIGPRDAEALGLVDGDRVRVRSRWGEAEAQAKVSEAVQAGRLFMPMHYVETNNLTMPSFDPYSRQPSFKYTTVSVTRA